jgi:NADH-quinone oxidoreductase subunit E
MLTEKFPAEVQAIFDKYPPEQKRSAVMPLLYLAQRESGYVTRAALEEIAGLCEISTTEVASLVGFYTLFRGQAGAPYRLQVCTDLPCALRGAEEFVAKLCENLGIQLGETTPDGRVTVDAVTCLAGCDKAPLFQVQSPQGVEYHENQTVESALETINSLKQEISPRSTQR